MKTQPEQNSYLCFSYVMFLFLWVPLRFALWLLFSVVWLWCVSEWVSEWVREREREIWIQVVILSFLDFWFCVSLMLENSQSLLLLPVLSFWYFNYVYVIETFWSFPPSLGYSFYFHFFKFSSLCVSVLVISIDLSGSSLILSLAIWKLLMRLVKAFFISATVFHL